jgi:uncharacterized OB-fold protein
MALQGEYLGMRVHVDELDQEHHAFFGWCGRHELRVQQCSACGLKRVPPTTACPFCAAAEATWQPVSGRGTVYSYGEVHHAIQPVFRAHTPYMLLLVELDEQRATPGEYDGLRLQANLATPDAELAPPDLVRKVGIGSRVRVVFRDIGEGIALPLWTLDEVAEQPAHPWRYPIE